MQPRNNSNAILACAACVLISWVAACAAEEPAKAGDWPADWKFRVVAQAAEQSDAYDFRIEHAGLGQPDGRDIRVAGPHGEPLSFIISLADTQRYRVIVDGVAGPGSYSIYFGNPASKLPPPPPGVCEFGRKDWRPKGGFSCMSYDAMGPIVPKQLISMEGVLEYTRTSKALSEAAEAEDAANQPDVTKRIKHVYSGVYSDASKTLAAPYPFFHVFRAEIEIAIGGKYDFIVANAVQSDRFGVVFADGDLKTSIVPGWYTMSWNQPSCCEFKGQIEFKPGVHVIEMYTNRSAPEIRMGQTGASSKVPDYLGGAYAHYPNALKIQAGPIEAAEGKFAENGRAIIEALIQQKRFANAQALCGYLQARFKNDPTQLEALNAEFDRLGQQTYEQNWLMEGKYPNRSNAVPQAVFNPPLLATAIPIPNRLDDKPRSGSCIWNEGRLIYGMPFSVQDLPWGLTSADCSDGELLFAGTKNGVMHALDLTHFETVNGVERGGSERWSFTSEGECLGAPLVYQGVLYYGTIDRRLYAIDIARGRMLWNFPAKGWIEGGPCAANGRIFFGSMDKTLYAIDAKLGLPRWETPLDGPLAAPPSTDGKFVFVGTTTGKFHAVDAANGADVWTYTAAGPIKGGACVSNGRVYFGDFEGKVHCLDAATGRLVWKEPALAGGPVISAPILLGGAIYGGTADGKLYGIELDSGVVGWRDTLPGAGEVCRPPLFADGKLVFASKFRGLFKNLGNGKEPGQPGLVAYSFGLNQKQIREADSDVAVDGKLDEPAWKTALTLALTKQNGFATAYANEARMLSDAKGLYIGVSCRDNPAADSGSPDDDVVSVLLDPKGDGMAVFQFSVTRAGQKSAALLTGVGHAAGDPKVKQALDQYKLTELGPNWAPTWTAQAAPLSGEEANGGWSAEIFVPFESLPKTVAPAPANGHVWRANILRSAGKTGSPARPALFLAPQPGGEGLGIPAQWQPLQFIIEKVKH